MCNRLEAFIYLAVANACLAEAQQQEYTSSISQEIGKDFIAPVPDGIEMDEDGKEGHKTIELAAIASFFEHIAQHSDETTVYENTIGMTLHGIDAVTVDKEGIYTVYEIKGTTRPLKKAESYLKKTKNKGQQLSWEWCWMSLVDMVEFPYTAPIFLELYKPLIRQQIRRKLAVVECKRCEDGSYTGERVHMFDAKELDIEEKNNLENPRRMLDELEQADG